MGRPLQRAKGKTSNLPQQFFKGFVYVLWRVSQNNPDNSFNWAKLRNYVILITQNLTDMAQFKMRILVFFMFLALVSATTNDTNSTGFPPPVDNSTNSTNGTASYPYPQNTTNSTNSSGTPLDYNTTNGTNGSYPYPPASNYTNSTNASNLSYAYDNNTNGSNPYPYPSNSSGNGSVPDNSSNSSYPFPYPSNTSGNGSVPDNGTNSSYPYPYPSNSSGNGSLPMNGSNSSYPYPYPSNASNNGSLPDNNTNSSYPYPYPSNSSANGSLPMNGSNSSYPYPYPSNGSINGSIPDNSSNSSYPYPYPSNSSGNGSAPMNGSNSSYPYPYPSNTSGNGSVPDNGSNSSYPYPYPSNGSANGSAPMNGSNSSYPYPYPSNSSGNGSIPDNSSNSSYPYPYPSNSSGNGSAPMNGSNSSYPYPYPSNTSGNGSVPDNGSNSSYPYPYPSNGSANGSAPMNGSNSSYPYPYPSNSSGNGSIPDNSSNSSYPYPYPSNSSGNGSAPMNGSNSSYPYPYPSNTSGNGSVPDNGSNSSYPYPYPSNGSANGSAPMNGSNSSYPYPYPSNSSGNGSIPDNSSNSSYPYPYPSNSSGNGSAPMNGSNSSYPYPYPSNTSGNGSVPDNGSNSSYPYPYPSNGSANGSAPMNGSNSSYPYPYPSNSSGNGSIPDNSSNSSYPYPYPSNSSGNGSAPMNGSNSSYPYPYPSNTSGNGSVPDNGSNSSYPYPYPSNGSANGSAPMNGSNSSYPYPYPSNSSGNGSIPDNSSNSSYPYPYPSNGSGNGSVPMNGTNSSYPYPYPSNSSGNGSVTSNGSSSSYPYPYPSNSSGNNSNNSNSSYPYPSSNGTTGNNTLPSNNSSNSTSNSTTNSPMTVTPNASFSPAPPINITSLLTLPKSSDGNFIGSNRLESLKIVNNAGNTSFILTSFSSTASNNTNTLQFVQPGNWTYVTGTSETLSCSLVYDYSSGNYGLVQYVSDKGTFSMIFRSPASLFSNTTNVTINDARTTTVLRENCQAAYQSNNLYRLTANLTLVPVTPPAGWTIASSPESLQFGVANNILYRYNSQNGTFTAVYTFPQNTAYEIRNSSSRLLVVAANKTGSSTTNYAERMYLFNTSSTNISLITQISFTAYVSVASASAPSVYPYLASPLLTKLGAVFNNASSSSTSTIIMRSIDPNTNAVSDLTFQEPKRFLATINTVAIDAPKVFGDFYFVVRNDSASAIVNTSFVEEAYQFVGNQIIFLRNRMLSTNDTTNFFKTYIDSATTNQLVVLNTFNVSTGLAIQQYLYGNIATVNKVIAPTTPSFILFPSPSVTKFVPTQNLPTDPLVWAFMTNTSNTTTISFIQANSSFSSNVQSTNITLDGLVSINIMNTNCFIVKDSLNNSNVKIVSFTAGNSSSSNSSRSYRIDNLSALLSSYSSSLTINNTTKWGISDSCDSFSANKFMFYRPTLQSNFTLGSAVISNSNGSAVFSRNLDLAYSGNSIWVFNKASVSWNPIINNLTLLSNIVLYTSTSQSGSKIIVTASNSTAAQVFAYYVDSTVVPAKCLDYSFASFQAEPKIQVSSQLSKVLVMGPFIAPNQTQSQPRFDGFFVAFANKTSINVTIPTDNIPDPVNSFILLDDQFCYIRSLSTSSVSTTNSSLPNPQENVYFISRDVTPLLASSVNLTQAQLTNWIRTAFSAVDDGKMKIYVETVETVNTTSYSVVNVRQVSGQQASLNSDSSQGVTGVVDSTGKVKLCGAGCSDCSSSTGCSACSARYVFDSSSSLCYPCGPNCATCSSTNTLTCTSCISFTYLSNGTCLSCDKSCLTCNVTATACTSCLPGQSLSAGQCNTTCPKNCISCSSNTTCITCISGFVVANGSCRGCVASCSNCSTTNITQCTSCAPGLTLVNSACVPCPDKCQTCSSGVCATCIPGFSPNANGVCVLACQISCATCADNQPSVCLSCYSGAYLNGSTCVLNTTCNTDLSCTDCGQGLDYILVGSMCVQCTSISNCLQCNTGNSQQCSKCFNGYYIDGNYLCQACPSSCITCNSADVCTGCVIGYTLPQNQTQGQCIACQSPCASCLGVSTYCLSCVDGYTKKGWKCQSNKYVGFSLVLVGAAPADILNLIDTLLQQLLTACRLNDTSSITFNSITSASTLVDGSSTSSDPASTSSALSSSLASGSLVGFSVGSLTVTTNGVQSDDTKVNTGMIVGIVVGVLVFVTAIVIVAYIIYKKKQAVLTFPEEGKFVIELENIDNVAKFTVDNEKQQLKAQSSSIQQVVLEELSHNGEKEIF